MKFTFNAKKAGVLGLSKPTAFDGLLQGNEDDPWWVRSPGVWGLTAGGALEAVAPPIPVSLASQPPKLVE